MNGEVLRAGGGGFSFFTLGAPVFDSEGHITPEVRFNDPTTAIDNRPLDLPSTAIIELSTIAGQMRAQVEYLQAKHLADVQTVNGE